MELLVKAIYLLLLVPYHFACAPRYETAKRDPIKRQMRAGYHPSMDIPGRDHSAGFHVPMTRRSFRQEKRTIGWRKPAIVIQGKEVFFETASVSIEKKAQLVIEEKGRR